MFEMRTAEDFVGFINSFYVYTARTVTCELYKFILYGVIRYKATLPDLLKMNKLFGNFKFTTSRITCSF